MSGAFLLCLVGLFALPISNRKIALLVLGWGMIFRITLIPAAPDQSEDVYRYLWDGRLASMGVDPFLFPPEAPELEGMRDTRLYPRLNSKPYRSVYPPLSQIIFRLSYQAFGPNIIPLKAVFSLLEFLSVLVAWRILVFLGRSLQTLYLLAWNPLFIFEFSHSGHSDSGMMFFVLLSIYLLCRSWKYKAMISYAGSILIKLYPALWLPLFARLAGWKAAAIGAVTVFTFFIAYFNPVSFIEYLGAMGVYLRPFEFNASIHYLLGYLGKAIFHQEWNQLTGPYLGMAALTIASVITWRSRVRSPMDVLHAGFWILTTVLCLATTVHPWYLSWPGLALPFFPYTFMIYWTGASFLSYLAYSYQPVHEPTWILLVEYIPMYLLMAWEIRRRAPLLEWLVKRRVDTRRE